MHLLTWLFVTALVGAEPQGARTVCYDGEVGAGPRLRRAILAVHGINGTISSAELELHGRPLRSTPVRVTRAADGSLQAAAADEKVALTFTTSPPDPSGELAGTVQIAGDERELRLRPAQAADGLDWILGDWNGAASFAQLVLHVKRGPCGLLAGTFDSPDQGQSDLPLTGVRATSDGVVLEAKYIGMTVSVSRGRGDALTAEFAQGAMKTPLRLERGTSFRRPQDPRPPYPYDEREARYAGAPAGVGLTGTLTVPRGNGPHPALILISGSGAQNRDEHVFGHRPFLVLADYLTRRGYAVLRVDDRGTGGSGGDVLRTSFDDLAGDVAAGLAWLRQQPAIDTARIGVLGHSEGGYIAPIVAARDPRVAFVILLGAPALGGRDALLAQRAALSAAAGDSEDARSLDLEFLSRVFDVLDTRPPDAELETRVEAAVQSWLAGLSAVRSAAARAMIAARTAEQDANSFALWRTTWFRSLYHHDPRPFLAAARVPVLAVYGELDLQVPAGPNAAALDAVLRAAGAADVTIARLPGVNHMLQRAKTGQMEEYALIDETMAPDALETIGRFLSRVAPPAAAREIGLDRVYSSSLLITCSWPTRRTADSRTACMRSTRA